MDKETIAKKFNRPVSEFGKRFDGRIEWYCEHGIGHTVWSPDNYMLHGCDGCCRELKEKTDDKK